jgi:hypothetical protein
VVASTDTAGAEKPKAIHQPPLPYHVAPSAFSQPFHHHPIQLQRVDDSLLPPILPLRSLVVGVLVMDRGRVGDGPPWRGTSCNWTS